MPHITGTDNQGAPFHQDAEISFHPAGKSGTFEIDDDQIGLIDQDAIYQAHLDGGSVVNIKIKSITPHETDPAIVKFDVV